MGLWVLEVVLKCTFDLTAGELIVEHELQFVYVFFFDPLLFHLLLLFLFCKLGFRFLDCAL